MSLEAIAAVDFIKSTKINEDNYFGYNFSEKSLGLIAIGNFNPTFYQVIYQRDDLIVGIVMV
ncbi:MAG: hypothetical protein V7L01_12920 [Nostoc sp.]|uniref:hypothetical protein n=1 Tax=Nostoc sp. TaxID=1180 RepID=UPI002FFB547A